MARTSNQAVWALVALGAVLWLLSQIWVYLVAVGAIALTGGFVWLVLRAVHVPKDTPHLTAAEGAPQGAAPTTTYRSLVAVDPAVFDDPTRAEVAALSVFSAWARQLPKAPRDASDVVRAMRLHHRTIGRLVTECLGKYVVWKQTPYGGRKPVIGPPVHPEDIDAWTANAAELKTRSRHFASCETCRATGKVACADCAGAGRLVCGSCNGAGKVYGRDARGAARVLNCKSCRGRGDVKCTECRAGKVPCGVCHGKKKLDRWLKIEQRTRQDIQVEPDGDATRAFVWGKDGVAATRDEVAADATITTELDAKGTLSRDAVAQRVPADWLDAHWADIAAQLQPGERIVRQTFQLLSVPTVEVAYSLDGQTAQAVDFEGRRMLAPPDSVDTLFHKRSRSLNWLLGILVAVPALVGIVYATRGEYFLAAPLGGMLAALCVAALGIYGIAWNTSLGRGAAKAWLPVAILPFLAASALAVVAEPRASAARTFIANGDLIDAERELSALGEEGDPDLAPLWADFRLASALRTHDWKQARGHASHIPASFEQAKKANAHVDELLADEAQQLIARGNPDGAEKLLPKLSKASQAGPRATGLRTAIAVTRVQQCQAAEDWACVFDRTGPTSTLASNADANRVRAAALEAVRSKASYALDAAKAEEDRPRRIDLTARANTLWTLWAAQTGQAPPVDLDRLQQQLERDQQAEAKAKAKRDAKEKRDRERAVRRLEREQQRQERRSRRQRTCCKVCTRGCPCGDSCISCSKTCRKGPGCAC